MSALEDFSVPTASKMAQRISEVSNIVQLATEKMGYSVTKLNVPCPVSRGMTVTEHKNLPMLQQLLYSIIQSITNFLHTLLF